MDDCRTPHAVMVPYPAQGHINPMMHLARKLASDGFIVSFVNTHFNHTRILQARNKMKSGVLPDHDGFDGNIRLMSVPDGLSADDSRTNFAKLGESMEKSMGPSLRCLIHRINQTQPHPVTCLIADVNIAGWAFDAAEHFHIPRAALWTMLIADYAIFYHIPSLVSSGILPPSGVPKEHKMVKCLPQLPPLHSSHLGWMIGSDDDREFNFRYTVRNMDKARVAEWVLFNSFYELEAPFMSGLFPREASIYPIGPLIPNDVLQASPERRSGISMGLWPEEAGCMEWLDKQSPRSVIYVSFGSLAVLNALQFQELAAGLEATARPFLWVVRSDLVEGSGGVFPLGFEDRIKGRGCLVYWAPQLSVLSHPAIACFLTHCGWNSTLESISMGVPMVCWPYFVDQFMNRTYIVDVWKIGLGLKENEDEIIERREIAEAVERILASEEGDEIRKRVVKMKESAREAVSGGGSSAVNYNLFVKAMENGLESDHVQPCRPSDADKLQAIASLP